MGATPRVSAMPRPIVIGSAARAIPDAARQPISVATAHAARFARHFFHPSLLYSGAYPGTPRSPMVAGCPSLGGAAAATIGASNGAAAASVTDRKEEP